MEHKVILDQIGRTIVGKVVSENDDVIIMNNPVILHAQPEANGQLQINSIPLFFFECIDKGSRDKNDWTFVKNNIVLSNVKVDDRLLSQYEKINTPVQEAPTSPNIISLDDL